MRRYRLLILAFPRAWRETYGDELLDLVAQEAHRRGQAIDLVRAGLSERRRTQAPSWAGALLALITASGSLLLCWLISASPQIQPVRWLLTAAFFGLLLIPLAARRAPLERNLMTPAALRRLLTASFIAVAAGSTATVITSTASSHPSKSPSRLASTQSTVPGPPSIQSTLSAQVAATPGIVAYLQSDVPKSVEFSNGHTVWVGTGNPTWTAQGSVYAPNGHTLAGTYQPVPSSNNTPVTWPTETVAAASAGN